MPWEIVENEKNKKKKNKRAIVILILLLLLFLVAGGVVLAVVLTPKEDFKLQYQVQDIHATVSAKFYDAYGNEKEFGVIEFEPTDDDSVEFQSINAGHINLSDEFLSVRFCYAFVNKSAENSFSVMLIDRAQKNNIAISYVVRRGEQEMNYNPTTGFVVEAGEEWSVEMIISVADMANDAYYYSTDEGMLSWVLTGLHEE